MANKPTPFGPRPAPAPMAAQHPIAAPEQMLAMVVACLLRERSQESEIHKSFAALVAERHARNHVRLDANGRMDKLRSVDDWRKCPNPICQEAARILRRDTATEITITGFTMQAVKGQCVMFQKLPQGLRVFLGEKSLIEKPMVGPMIVRP